MSTLKGAAMALTLKDGKMMLQIDPTEIETKGDAERMAQLIQQFAASLPEKLPRQRKPASRAKAASSRPTTSRRRPNAVDEPAGTEAAATAGP